MLNYITWTVNPNIFDGFLTIRWYGLMFVIGFWIGYKIVYAMFKHEGVPESWIDKLFIYVVVATIIGSRLGHVFFYEWDYYSAHPVEIFKIWEGGLASHGGTIAIIIAIFIYSKYVTQKSVLWTFDRLVIPVALVGALIRMGNLFNHEIYGHPTDMPWGFRFVENMGAWLSGHEPIFSLPSHPTQIYEALAYLALFGLLMWMYWKKNMQSRPGLIFGIFLTWLFSARFFIEFVKNDQVLEEANMAINIGQQLSIPFIIAGIALIIYALKRPAVELKFPNKFPVETKK